jgi:hypothetical protein
MKSLKNYLSIFLTVLLFWSVSGVFASEVKELGKPGTKTAISPDWTLTYSFNTNPAMGNLIVKVKILDKDGNPVDGLTVIGISDMAEMHDSNSGKVEFVQNKKKDFLLPINVSMPGAWNVMILVKKQKKVLFTGRIDFHV